jgi:hypothetical protein
LLRGGGNLNLAVQATLTNGSLRDILLKGLQTDLPAGVDTIILPGIVPPGGSIRYSLNATQGQQLSLNFIVTANQLAVAVSSPDGTVVKSREAALPWSASLSTSGDYLIEIVNADSAAAQPYVLELRRSPPN